MEESSVSAELQALSSKRASLKDRLKRRREAVGSILSLAQGADAAAAAAAAAPVIKAKEEQAKRSPQPPPKPVVQEVKKKVEVAAIAAKDKEEENVNEAKSAPSPEAAKPLAKKSSKSAAKDDILSLLSTQSAKERQDKERREEILELLSRPTAKERTLTESFKSRSGGGVREFCPHSTKVECAAAARAKSKDKSRPGGPCDKLHFARIIQPHTDETLGDCSFLNTCFHMDTCKYIHYEVDMEDVQDLENRERQRRKRRRGSQSGEEDSVLAAPLGGGPGSVVTSRHLLEARSLVPPQWVQCDLRNFELSVLGKFAVVMADPPWDIHMELPYGTMSDDEMRRLPVPALQDEGLIFLWVTGRAMELGRECLKLWGYRRVDELIWVKTNQLQRIIRTGRTGHWLNHGKEHCLVGAKGDDLKLNRGLVNWNRKYFMFRCRHLIFLNVGLRCDRGRG